MSITELVCRVLGFVAPMNERLSRLRANLIPTNILLMLALGVIVAGTGRTVAIVLAARKAPAPQPLSDLLLNPRPTRNYVALEGRLVPDARIDFEEEGSQGNLELADHAWVPLVDRASGKAILVQVPAGRSFDTNGDDVTVEGMLRPIPRAVSRQLSQGNYMHAGRSIDSRFMLVEGRRPGSLTGPFLYGGIAAILLLPMAWSTLTRNVIFMPADRAPGATLVAQQGSLPVLVSGRLAFDARTSQFFTNMPAVIQRMDSGDTALVSHLETSRTVWGMKTDVRSGAWVLAIRAGSVTNAEAGHVFWGSKKLHAIRFRYVSGLTGASERAVVASAVTDPVLLFQGR
jgi:hypothetical protein